MKRFLFFLLLLTSIKQLQSQAWNRNFPIFYQEVNAMAQYGDTLFVGGSFNNVGPNEGRNTVLDSATGNVNTTFPRIYGYSKLVPDGNGGMYVLGNASLQIGGQFRNRLAHVYANGTLSAWNPNPNNNTSIKDLQVYGDKIYISGNLDTIGGQKRRYMAALDTITGAATSWNPNIDQPITSFTVTNNAVYVAGQFTFIAGQVRGVLAAFDATTGAITSWDPSAGTVFTATNPAVTRLEAVGNTIYVGGNFTSIGGQARNSPVAIDATTGAVTPWNLNLSPSGASANWVISNNKMYLTGNFTSISGQPRNGIACVDLATGVLNSFNPGALYTNLLVMASSFVVSGNTIYISYSYPVSNNFIIALDATTGVKLPWAPPFLHNGYPPISGVTYATIIAGKVFATGYFYSVNAQTITSPLAAISATTGNILNLNYNVVHGAVSKLVTVGSKLYVLGSFDSIGGQRRTRLAAINLTNGLVTPWNPTPNNTVTDLAVNAGTVYLSGTFTSVGGQVRNYLAAVDTGTGLATTWAPVVNTTGNVLTVNANKLYVGGSFTTIGGQARSRLVSFDLSTGSLTSWNPNPNGDIIGFAKNDSSIFVLGSFTNISSQSRNKLAAFDLTTDSLKSFNSALPASSSPILGLVTNNSRVYVYGGSYTQCSFGGSGCVAPYFACADARTGQNIPWNYSIGGGFPNSGLGGTTANGIYAAHLYGSNIYVGGMFLNVGSYTSASFAVFGDTTTPALPPVSFISFQGQRLANDTIQLNWQTANENYISGYEVQRSTDSINFTTVGAVALSSSHTYQFKNISTDSVVYYRIKAVPTANNTVRYSSVIKLVKPPLPPVRFTGFQGQRQTNGTVQLSWQTADENYVSGYEVQRSTDSINFIARGTVALNAAHSYQFTDQTTDTLNYYRIRAIPTNSNIRYSGVLKLSVQQPQQNQRQGFSLYPNPSANNQLQLHVDSLAQGNYTIGIYTLSGYRVVQKTFNHNGGQVNVSANVSRLTGGMYIVTLRNASGSVIFRQRWMKL